MLSAQSIRRRIRRGFTLVEILAVLVIIGIASAVVIPQLGTRDDLRVAAAARVLVADLIYAQNMAISTGKTVYVRFDSAAESYKLLSVALSTGDTIMTHPMTQQPYIQQFGPNSSFPSVYITSAIFNGVDPSYSNEFTVAFDEMGAPYAFSYDMNDINDFSTGTIVLQSGTFSSTITVQPYTGEILVQ